MKKPLTQIKIHGKTIPVQRTTVKIPVLNIDGKPERFDEVPSYAFEWNGFKLHLVEKRDSNVFFKYRPYLKFYIVEPRSGQGIDGGKTIDEAIEKSWELLKKNKKDTPKKFNKFVDNVLIDREKPNRVKFFANKGKAVDCYTMVFLDDWRYDDDCNRLYDCLSFSENPQSPQGVCLMCECHLFKLEKTHKEIKFHEFSKELRSFITNYCNNKG